MITITIQNGHPNIWNASDWLKVREESRIVGNLTGCLVGLPRQNTFQGLPLTLLKEEVTLLLEKNLAHVVDDKVLSKAPDERAKDRFDSYKENNKKQQMECYESQRQKQITSMIDKIIEGKRRKLLGLNTKKRKLNSTENSKSDETSAEGSSQLELDREEILKNELNKSAENFAPPLLVHTFTREQWIDEAEFEKVSWNFPETPQEKLRYNTFKDLWEKGFYITEGHKFGVDFLVYPDIMLAILSSHGFVSVKKTYILKDISCIIAEKDDSLPVFVQTFFVKTSHIPLHQFDYCASKYCQNNIHALPLQGDVLGSVFFSKLKKLNKQVL